MAFRVAASAPELTLVTKSSPMAIPDLLAESIPSVITVLGVGFGVAYLRKTNKEQNQTSAFGLVTDQLFKLNDGFRADLELMRRDLKDVKSQLAEKDARIEGLEDELEEGSLLVRSLAQYIRRLINKWPTGTPVPPPEPPVDWTMHV